MALTEERFLQLMKMMNDEQANNIERKVANQLETVKKDLSGAIAKVSDRQDNMEEDQKAMKTQMVALQEQLEEIKTASQSKAGSSPCKTYAAVAAGCSGSTYSKNVPMYTSPAQDESDANENEVAEIIDVARRTVGLYKIDRSDLARMRLEHFGGATTEEEEKKLAVKEYLRCELKFGPEEIEDMEVESIFIPAKDRGDPQSLNVTFRSLRSVSRIFEKTRIMRKESRIINYIPRQFQDRLSAVSTLDYKIRADKKYQTRIKMGLYDLELHRKLRGSSKWERVALPSDLPPVDLHSRPAQHLSNSPPPGRPGHDYDYSRDSNKRGRESTGSNSDQNVSKVAKQSTDTTEVANDVTTEHEDSFLKKVEKADLVSEGKSSPGSAKKVQDPGTVTSVQGTPAKLNPGLLSFHQSPIITKSGRKI